MVMFDSLNSRMLGAYGCADAHTPNFDRLAKRAVTFDNCYIAVSYTHLTLPTTTWV